MKLLIVDDTSEGHDRYTRIIDRMDRADIDFLDLDISLATENDYEQHVPGKDLLLIGSGVESRSTEIARRAVELQPGISIIMFISTAGYSGGAFRSAYAAGARKVLSDGASHLDLLQELIAIYDDLRRRGRVSEGRCLSFIQAKGGTGVTTIAASLADIANEQGKRVLLWDFDVETQDLCRSLSMASVGSPLVSSWLEGSAVVNRENLRHAVFELTDNLHLLPPPRVNMADGMDLVCHTDAISLVNRVMVLARSMYDITIVDVAGKLGPATGALIRDSDGIVCVIDDSIMGLTGLNLFLQYLEPLLAGDRSLRFLINGAARKSLAIKEVQESLAGIYDHDDRTWNLPCVPVDSAGANWAGSGGTLYSHCNHSTRKTLEEIAMMLGIVSAR